MTFSDLALARRLESAEGFACTQFAAARMALQPGCGSAWVRTDSDVFLTFDGVDAPTTQTFGLGLSAEVTTAALDEIEAFFTARGSSVLHEVCPLAGTALLSLLCMRGYQPMEISHVLYRTVESPPLAQAANIQIRVVAPEEAPLWSDVSARAWAHDHPEIEDFVRELGPLCVARASSPCFLAEIDGLPGASGALILHHGVALFGGASTLPEFRRRGLQAALLEERMRYAAAHHCDLAMMVAEAGSNSQRNAERQGFRVAYTRIKWKLSPSQRA